MIKAIVYDFVYIFVNYIVGNIPCWTIRKLFYCILGMKIGKKSRIKMKCVILEPWHIKIGENTVINEFCYIDGRGSLEIGNNCSISVYTIIYTASHDVDSEKFKYYEKKTIIEDNVWIGARTTILAGTVIKKLCVIGANSFVRPKVYIEKCVYAGVPAKKIKNRKIDKISPQKYQCFFI